MRIVFSKHDLYSMFLDSLCKELRAIVDNKDKKVFITHVRGLRCMLTCNIADNSIVVTVQGHRLWKETAFIRLTRGLYRNFTTEMDKELSTSRRLHLCVRFSAMRYMDFPLYCPVMTLIMNNYSLCLMTLKDRSALCNKLHKNFKRNALIVRIKARNSLAIPFSRTI